MVSPAADCVFQMQTHGCLQLAEEAEREHKKVADKITERTEVVKVPVHLRSRLLFTDLSLS
jgi:hypothetical protein